MLEEGVCKWYGCMWRTNVVFDSSLLRILEREGVWRGDDMRRTNVDLGSRL